MDAGQKKTITTQIEGRNDYADYLYASSNPIIYFRQPQGVTVDVNSIKVDKTGATIAVNEYTTHLTNEKIIAIQVFTNVGFQYLNPLATM
jgi:hypothetical protein